MKGTKPATNTGRRVARWGLVLTLAGGCMAPAADAPSGDPQARIHAASIDATKLLTLAGNTHPSANAENSTGPVDDAFPIEHMQLVLHRSATQQTALDAHMDALHDKTSPLYHQWLTATEFGDQYGVSPADVAVIVQWLESYGFHVDGVPPSRMFLEFSGTAAQVSAAFHTRIHNLQVNGVHHFGNMSDPQIPEELAKAVTGVHALHDFMPHTMHKRRGVAEKVGATGAWRVTSPTPDLTIGPYGGCTTAYETTQCTSKVCNATTGNCTCTSDAQCAATLSGAAAKCNTKTQTCVQCQSNADCIGPATCDTTTNLCTNMFQAVTPADFATIYNLNPLFADGITGKGQTVVVIEDTTIANASDVTAFRSAFGLSGYPGTFSQITPTGTAKCTNPGVNGAESEAALDAEWAGASAPGAAIELAACADTTVFGGLVAVQNLINGAAPPTIMSISYGECESANGATANASYVTTYQQAAMEGVSVFVSAGDEGAASCDADKAAATKGIAVSGFASTPYNVAVGGTDFGDYYNNQNGGPALSSYWAASNTSSFGSALGYVPEVPWNDSCASKLVYSTPSIALASYTEGYGATGFCNSTIGSKYFRTTGAGSGGPSNYSAQPTWQAGVVGLPTKSGGKRYLPDVSLFAADGVYGHFLVYCLTDTAQGGGPCTYTSANDTLALAAGGTSFASPALAGIQALINQKMSGAQGNPNYTYYKLAAAEQGANGTTRCNSTGGTPGAPVLPHEECIFNDVTLGDIDVNCTGTTDCYGYSKTGGTTTDGSLSPSTTTYSPAYAAGTGWDFATGLGTVNAYNLVTAWSK
jgi:subtilase family serine protease